MLILATSCFPFRLGLEYACAGRRSSRGKQTDTGNANIEHAILTDVNLSMLAQRVREREGYVSQKVEIVLKRNSE